MRFISPVIQAVNRFNDVFAFGITRFLGSMWCAYLMAAYSIWTAPATIKALGFGNWLIEAFLQFVLLSIIMVGQNVIDKRQQEHAVKLQEHTELIKQVHGATVDNSPHAG